MFAATAATFTPETQGNFVDACDRVSKKAYCCGTIPDGPNGPIQGCAEVTKTSTGLLDDVGGVIGDIGGIVDGIGGLLGGAVA
jgi:hypothetical protein